MRASATLALALAAAALAEGPERIETVDRGRRTAACDLEAPPSWTRAVARVSTRTADGRVRHGTAVLVAPDLALTALHNLAGAEGRAVLRFGLDGERDTVVARRTAGEAAAHDTERDWVILRLDAPVEGVRPLRPAGTDGLRLDRGRVRAAGYSADATLGRGGRVLTWDDHAKVLRRDRRRGLLVTDAVAYRGASGGPVFFRERARDRWHWIGILHASTGGRASAGFHTFVLGQEAYRAELERLLAPEPSSGDGE